MLNSLYLAAYPFVYLGGLSSAGQFIKSGISTVQAWYETCKPLNNPTKAQDKKLKKIVTERYFSFIKNGLISCAVGGLASYMNSQLLIKPIASLAQKISTTFSHDGSQANPTDPRKLMTILRADLTNDPVEVSSNLFFNSQLPKWHQVFDVVARKFDAKWDISADSYSIFRLNNIFHNITRVGEQIKRISLLLFNGHGNEWGLQLSNNDFFYSHNAEEIDWDDYLTSDAKIVLLSCSTASGENSFAEQLSKIANRTVIAAIEPIILPADIQYSPDLSSLSVEFFKQSLSEPAGARVFCPSDSCHGAKVITNDCLSGVKLISETAHEVLETMDLSSIGLMYSLSVIGAGMTGYGLKGLNYVAKKTHGEGTWTRRVDSVASALTGVFNFHVNLAPNICSGIYEGAKHLTQSIINLTYSTKETQPAPQNCSNKKKR